MFISLSVRILYSSDLSYRVVCWWQDSVEQISCQTEEQTHRRAHTQTHQTYLHVRSKQIDSVKNVICGCTHKQCCLQHWKAFPSSFLSQSHLLWSEQRLKEWFSFIYLFLRERFLSNIWQPVFSIPLWYEIIKGVCFSDVFEEFLWSCVMFCWRQNNGSLFKKLIKALFILVHLYSILNKNMSSYCMYTHYVYTKQWRS